MITLYKHIKTHIMKKIAISLSILIMLSFTLCSFTSTDNETVATMSSETETCIACHASLHPGIVKSWENSLHSKITPTDANNKDDLEKRVSSMPENQAFSNVTVGCYECHSLNTDKHADAFEHNGFTINVVVTPDDCSACHNEEKKQYDNNLMSHAYANLMENEVYKSLKSTINNDITFKEGSFHYGEINKLTDADACLHCHGTKLEVKGTFTKETDFGELSFPKIEGWPNQGVGRINPDGSKGSCTSCHPRHTFSIKTARTPDACAQCHKGPDVPAYKVYQVSSHGKIYNSSKDKYDLTSVPWVIGKDFDIPTCATCHVSLITDVDGNVVAERTHQFNDRLSSRLFGVPYAHPHPISPETHKIVNDAGLQLATNLDGSPASSFLISKEEQEKRNNTMKQICNKCHSSNWTDNHFARLNDVIRTTNESTLAATQILSKIWEEGYADNSNLFDEYIERQWVDIWLFHANGTRLSAAMAGGGDYGVFADGRYQLTNKLFYLLEWLNDKENQYKKKKSK